MSDDKTTKAVAYLRVSGASQIDGEGFGRQLDAITNYANSHGYELAGTYQEEAVSGKTDLAARPAFLAMLADLLGNGCRVIIVERLDRLAREYRIQEELLLYLMRHGVTLISADTGEDITAAMAADPMRKFLVQMQGLLAELDKNLLVAKLAKARQRVRDRGEYAGGRRPYGMDPKRATAEQLAASARERETVARIRELRQQGLILRQIRDTLEREGRPARNGGKWQLSTISEILRFCKL